MTLEQIENILYQRMCNGCPKEKECHDNCEHCDNYLNELEKENNNEL